MNQTGHATSNPHHRSLRSESLSNSAPCFPTRLEAQSNLDAPTTSDISQLSSATLPRIPQYHKGSDAVSAVTKSMPKPKRKGWKPQDFLEGSSISTALQPAPLPRTITPERKPPKRKHTEDFAPVKFQNPSRQDVPNSIDVIVKKRKLLERSQNIENGKKKVSNGERYEIRTHGKQHSKQQNGSSENKARSEQRISNIQRQHRLTGNDSERQNLIKSIDAVQLADHGEATSISYNEEIDTRHEFSTTSPVTNAASVNLSQSPASETARHSNSRQEKEVPKSQGEVRNSGQISIPTSIKPKLGFDSETVRVLKSRKVSPRLNHLFKRDVLPDAQDDEGDTDELIRSSPRTGVVETGDLTTKLSPTFRGLRCESPKFQSGDFPGDERSIADIPQSHFQNSKCPRNQQKKSTLQPVHKGVIPTKAFRQGKFLQTYMHQFIHEGPSIIYFLRQKPVFKVEHTSGIVDEVSVQDILKASFNMKGGQAKLDTVRSNDSPNTTIILVFPREEDLQWFRLELRLRGILKGQEIDIEESRMTKIVETRRKQSVCEPKPVDASGTREEMDLLELRVRHGSRHTTQQAPALQKVCQNMAAIPRIPGLKRDREPTARRIRKEARLSKPGIDTTIFDAPSENSMFKAQTKSFQKSRDDAYKTIATKDTHDNATEHVSPHASIFRRTTRARRSTENDSWLDPQAVIQRKGEVVKFSETGGLGQPWEKSLFFPSSGPDRATVEFADLSRLDDDEFLNDDLVQFGLRHAQEQHPHHRRDVYMFNTYFYSSLTNGMKNKKQINYDAVKRWTSKVDLFDYNYIIVPINENLHWYVAIICNVRNAGKSSLGHNEGNQFHHSDALLGVPGTSSDFIEDPINPSIKPEISSLASDQALSKYSVFEQHGPRIVIPIQEQRVQTRVETFGAVARRVTIPAAETLKKRRGGTRKHGLEDFVIATFDSFGQPRPPAIRNLKEYLREEAKNKRGIILEDPGGMTARGLPEQTNFSDCGLFLIAYIRQFLRDPAAFVQNIFQRETDVRLDWSDDINPHEMRSDLRSTILQEYRRQHPLERELADRPRKQSTPEKSQMRAKLKSHETKIRVSEAENAAIDASATVKSPSLGRYVQARPAPQAGVLASSNRGRHATTSKIYSSSIKDDDAGSIELIDRSVTDVERDVEAMSHHSQGQESTEISDVRSDSDTDMLDRNENACMTDLDTTMSNSTEPNIQDTQDDFCNMSISWREQLEYNAGEITTMEQDTQEMYRRSASHQPAL